MSLPSGTELDACRRMLDRITRLGGFVRADEAGGGNRLFGQVPIGAGCIKVNLVGRLGRIHQYGDDIRVYLSKT